MGFAAPRNCEENQTPRGKRDEDPHPCMPLHLRRIQNRDRPKVRVVAFKSSTFLKQTYQRLTYYGQHPILPWLSHVSTRRFPWRSYPQGVSRRATCPTSRPICAGTKLWLLIQHTIGQAKDLHRVRETMTARTVHMYGLSRCVARFC
jgi:hypothetical protein